MEKKLDMIDLYDAIHLLCLDLRDLTSSVFLIKEGILYSDSVASVSVCGVNVVYHCLEAITEKIEKILIDCKEMGNIDEEDLINEL